MELKYKGLKTLWKQECYELSASTLLLIYIMLPQHTGFLLSADFLGEIFEENVLSDVTCL